MSSVDERILEELKNIRQEIRILREVNLLSGTGLPLSDWWTWQQFNVGTFTLAAASSEILVQDSDLFSGSGYLHSLDIQASSGNTFIRLRYSSRNTTFQIKGLFSDFRAAEFSEHVPISAGDPIVVDRATASPNGTGETTPPEWAARISPSFNVPFNTPFILSLENNSTAAITVYGYDIYFLMLTPPDGVFTPRRRTGTRST